MIIAAHTNITLLYAIQVWLHVCSMSLTVYIRVKTGGTHWKMLKMGSKIAEIQQTRKAQWIFPYILMADAQYMYSNNMKQKNC